MPGYNHKAIRALDIRSAWLVTFSIFDGLNFFSTAHRPGDHD
jgi:hypothetical protein